MNYKIIAAGASLGLAALLPLDAFAADAGSYADLVSCVNGEEAVCTLTEDIALSKTLSVTRDVSIDLNGHSITPAGKFDLIAVKGAKLNVVGTGTIGTDSSYSAFQVVGSTDETATNYSILNVDKDVTLKANDYAIWVPNIKGSDNKYHAYGAVVNFGGTIDSTYGFYLNGTVQDIVDNAPTFNIQDGATIKTNGHVVYGAGYANWTFGAAKLEGLDGIGIKAGVFEFNDTTITTTAEYSEPASWNNGMNTSGAVFQIESNDAYADNISITVNGGVYTSKNGHVFYEYKDAENTTNSVQDMVIKGGSFIAAEDKSVFQVSGNFKLAGFIQAGEFSGEIDPSFIATGAGLEETEAGYTVESYASIEGAEDAVKALDLDDLILNITIGSLSEDEQELFESLGIEGLTEGKTFDIQALGISNGDSAELNDLDGNKVTITLEIPEELRTPEEGFVRAFYIIRIHDGEAKALDAEVSDDNSTITFSSDLFSAYTLTYADTKAEEEPEEENGEDEISTDATAPNTGVLTVSDGRNGNGSVAGIAGVTAAIIVAAFTLLRFLKKRTEA